MKSRFFIFLWLSCSLLAGCIREDEPHGADLRVGDPVPDFSVTLNDGRIFGSDMLESGTGYILFFNTDCEDCRRELPEMQELFDALPAAEQRRFVCIAREEDNARIEAFWKQYGLSMPYSPQQDRTIYNLFATYSIPRLYVTRDGVIVEIHSEEL